MEPDSGPPTVHQQSRRGRNADASRAKGELRLRTEKAESIFASNALEILYSTREDELEALSLFGKYADQEVSFTDCVSFVLMKSRHIGIAFTFDRHFGLAGWRRIP